MTRKNIQRYYTLKCVIRYMFSILLENINRFLHGTVRAYDISYASVVDVSEIERVSAVSENFILDNMHQYKKNLRWL